MAVRLEKQNDVPTSKSKNVTTCLFILTQYRHWTERQTELVEQYRCLHVLQADAR